MIHASTVCRVSIRRFRASRPSAVWASPRRAWIEALEPRRVLSVTPTIHRGKSITLELPSSLVGWWVNGAEALKDGSIAVLASGLRPATPDPAAPEQQALLKLTPDGQWDRAFGNEGVVLLPGYAEKILFEPDGSLLAYGRVFDDADFEGAFAFLGLDTTKVTADGALDPTWGTNGYERVPFDLSNENVGLSATMAGDHVVVSASARDLVQDGYWDREERIRKTIELRSDGSPIPQTLQTAAYTLADWDSISYPHLERATKIARGVAATEGVDLDWAFFERPVETTPDAALHDTTIAMDTAFTRVWTVESTLYANGYSQLDVDAFEFSHPLTENGEVFPRPDLRLVRREDGSLVQLGTTDAPFLYLFYGPPHTAEKARPPAVVDDGNAPKVGEPHQAVPVVNAGSVLPTLAMPSLTQIGASSATAKIASTRSNFILRSVFDTHDELWWSA